MRQIYLFFILFFALHLPAADRITRRLDPNQTVPVRGNLHPAATPQFDQGETDAALPIEYATILFKPAPGLEQFLANQQNPTSTDFHNWLTPEQFASRFGLTDNDVAQVADWLRSQGLKVHDIARGRLWISFSGKAGIVGRAFHTSFRRYRVPTASGTESHFANSTDPSVPKAFESVVAGFDGFHDFQPKPLYVKGRMAKDGLPQYNNGRTVHNLGPGDFAAIYDVNPLYASGLDGSGQKIAVIGRTNISISDIRTFRILFNLPANDPQVVLFGPDPGINSGDQVEAHLDVQWAGAVAKNATIVYVNSRSVSTSAQYAIDQNLAPIITYSYATCERSSSLAQRFLAQQANAQGITWIAAAGDWGATTCDFSAFAPQSAKGPTLAFPASVPEITAIGGTAFNEGDTAYWAATNDPNGTSALGYIPETVWNDTNLIDDFSATAGGGPSSYFPKPYWQIGSGVPNDNARDVPDISLAASGSHDGYLIVQGGALMPLGGTSAGAPAFAGLVALLNQSLSGKDGAPQNGLGNINPTLYRMAQSRTSAFHDVVDGDNRVPCAQSSPGCVNGLVGFSAAPGYDLATGLGSIDAAELITNWDLGTVSQTAVTANPSTTAMDGTIQLTATVTGKAAAPPSGNLSFFADDTLLGSAALQSDAGLATASLTVDAQRLFGGISDGKVTALYGGNDVYTSSSATVKVNLQLPASGSFVVPSISPNPVYQVGNAWPYTVSLTEKNGVATKLTNFLVDGVNNNANIASLASGNIPASGSVSLALSGTVASPRTRLFEFSGSDRDGRPWSTQISVPFLGPVGPPLFPQIVLTSSPRTGVLRNPQADDSCQWSHQLNLHEMNGYWIQLTSLSTGPNATADIQSTFGTTRLAPYGSLSGKLCLSNLTPGDRTLSITGSAETGATVTSSISVQYAGTAPSDGLADVSNRFVAFSVPDSQSDSSASVSLNLNADTPWTLGVTPPNRTTSWLKVTPLSGTGPATLNLQVSPAGLSNGAYPASLTVETPTLAQQYLTVPVTLTIGASDSTKITAVTNLGSGQPVYAPGMLARVTGSNLAPVTRTLSSTHLPLKVSGVSATVNGISAPLSALSSDEVALQIPYEVGIGPAILAINNDGQIASFPINVAIAAPGLFSLTNSFGAEVGSVSRNQSLTVLLIGAGEVTPIVFTGESPASGTPATRLPTPRLPLVATIGGVAAKVDFAGIRAGKVGIVEISLTVPSDAPTGSQQLVVTIGGIASQPIHLDVR